MTNNGISDTWLIPLLVIAQYNHLTQGEQSNLLFRPAKDQ